jgi:GMP synthase-like glutamine amidotransferase
MKASTTIHIVWALMSITSWGSRLKTANRFLVINCEDIPWEPISFSDMYRRCVELEGDSWNTCNIALGEQLPADIHEYTGIILSGSHYNCRKRDVYFPWYEGLMVLVREISVAGEPKLFGGCFGHNLIALALGGSIDFNPDKKYILQIEKLTTNDAFKKQFSATSCSPLRDSYSVISTHEDCVIKLPDTATLLGSTLFCKNHLFVTGKNNNILACQSHPEFDLKYAVMDRIWIGVVEKRRMLSKSDIVDSLRSFEEYDGTEAKDMCAVISDFLRSPC